MRENTKWIMLITALAFVALMVFEWGMDITGRSTGGLGEIGQVNGTPVMYDDYMSAYRNLYDRVQSSQEEPITSQRNTEIEDAAFDDLVTQILLSQELERRGIRVTDEEILQAARYGPPPEVRQQPLFQTEGQFDLQKYQQYITSPGADPVLLQYLEAYYRQVLPRAKLMRQVTSGVYFTDEELWRRWRDEHETATIRYVAMEPGQRVADAEVEVSESEMRSYYEDHEEDFEVPARARVEAVVLRKAPTAADTAAMWERAGGLRERLAEGADFAEVARLESDDPLTAEQGGELGVVPQGRMVGALDSAVFATPAGSLAGPVATPSGLHVLEVQERWGQDSARVRHVLVPFARTDDSEIELLTLTDSVEDLSESRPLAEAATMVGLETRETEITDQFAFLPGAGQIGEGGDWVFEEAAPGEVSPIFENAQAFYALEVQSTTPGGIQPFEEVREQVRDILLMEKKVQRAEERARALVERIRGGAALEEVAGEEGLELQEAGPFTRNDFVPGLGRYNAAIGAAFGLDVGEVGDPVTANREVYLMEKVGGTPADRATWEAQKDAQRRQLLQQVEQQRINDWIEGLRASARIVDRRAEVLRAAEEQEEPGRPMPSMF